MRFETEYKSGGETPVSRVVRDDVAKFLFANAEMTVDPKQPSELEKAQQSESNTGFFKDLFYFLRHNKKWWLLPILLILLLMSVLMLLSTTGAAPFIYTLF
jgi:Family of unknown function (DUF5989)